MLLISTIFFIYLTSAAYSAKKIPSYVTLCKRADPDLDECVKKSALELLPRLMEGAPELSLPSINPFRMPEVQLKNSNFVINFKNLELYASGVHVDTLQIGIDEHPHIHLTVTISNVGIISDYESSGKLLLLEMNGKGKAKGNFTNVHLELTNSAKIIKKKGKDFLELNDGFDELEIEVEGGNLNFDNLAGGDEKLSELINNTLNENFLVLLEEFKPLLKSVISGVGHSIIKTFFKSFSLDDLFPV